MYYFSSGEDVKNISDFEELPNDTISNNGKYLIADLVVDLERCEDGMLKSRILPFGSQWVGILDKGKKCKVYVGGETENPNHNGDSYTPCSLSKDLGKVSLKDISDLCSN